MKFQRLRMQGFKSFCDPTDLILEPGLTGVVGPNGCGKSNLMEAMRWVMGESSYKAMRATGMEDVIFSGSTKRPGRNSAEVTLVLDNSDRTAPTLLNDADVLEISRRIERDHGSVYRVNGKEVRARDVQLLFADASTGAHSPALVRQGQIGELIAAKPVKRRALLEEAAGISGLYSRRHEAELRLKGAENNLERVDDIIAQVETQLDTLKRQARLAVRYRNISGDIRKAEATLFHVRWVMARLAEKETEASQGQMVKKLADAHHQNQKSAKILEEAERAQQPLRDQDVAAGAVVQRLTILREQLETEIRRASGEQLDLENRQKQIANDAARETQLIEEGTQVLLTYGKEKSELQSQHDNQASAIEKARVSLTSAEEILGAAQKRAQETTESLAQLRAKRAHAQRLLEDSDARATRLTQQIDDVNSEAQNVRTELGQDQVIVQHQHALSEAKSASLAAENASERAEESVRVSQGKLDAARPALTELQNQLNRLESEAETLARVLNVGDNELWPAIVDRLKVKTGYEIALGAALGDDLEASFDSGAPIYWAEPGTSENDPALPTGITPLSAFVSGAKELKRGLDQVGLVKDVQNGHDLMVALKPGQRLITTQGDLWRWDGLVIKADAPSPAAQRLSQRNRLADLDGEISALQKSVAEKKSNLDALTLSLSTAQADLRAHQASWREAQHAISDAQERLDIAQKAVGDLVTRQSALEEAKIRLASSLVEAKEIHADAQKALNECEPEADAVERQLDIQRQVNIARDTCDTARMKLANRENESRMRSSRITQLEGEMQGWQRRCDEAKSQLQTLTTRSEKISDRL
ncbi:MAG TPA: chromosome segregation protein SMC, partial [Devosia sp.]|nr:chromosome segregation protein SMC [Devosia sp.]